MGEKCGMQFSFLGPAYFKNMNLSIFLKMNETEKKCYEANINPSKDYIDKCDCPLECFKTQYSVDHSGGKRDKEILNYTDHTHFSIFYNEMEETIIKEEPKTELPDLISTIGGLLGLFTGFSFLSLIEAVEMIAKIVIILIGDRKNRLIESTGQETATSIAQIDQELSVVVLPN